MNEDVRTRIYTPANIERLANAGRGVSRHWFDSSWGDDMHHLSFLDLIEFLVVWRLRQHGFSYRLIREIATNTQNLLHVERPLVTAQFQLSGKDIFIQLGTDLVEVGRRRGQAAWTDVLSPFLTTLDYTEGIATAWWPLGKDHRVKVAPNIGFGFPVVAGSGVRTEIIRERFAAGDSPEMIAEDYGLDVKAVEDALRFELRDSA